MASKGFTLIEISIAFLLFSIAVLPIFGVLMQTIDGSSVIESQRFAQEQGYNVIISVMERVPFEMLWASDAEWNPASIRAQSSPSLVNGTLYDSEYADHLVSSIFPGSTEACYSIINHNGIAYELLLEVTDIAAAGSSSLEGASWHNPATWNELYFDFYPIPDFYLQPEWNHPSNVNNDAMIAANYVTPYRYFEASLPGIHWGPAERNVNGAEAFGNEFPRTQRDRSLPWSDWGNIYCQMKRLRLRIRWNLTPAERSDTSLESSHRRELVLIAYKSNVMSSGSET